jgi:asparagine synthase (glutamine-hydrolysing)
VVAVAGRFSLVGDVDGDDDPAVVGCARWLLGRLSSGDPIGLDRVAGSFSIVVADPANARVSLFRDHLGDLELAYSLTERSLVAATEAAAVLGDGDLRVVPDEQSIARFLGFRFGHSERSFFRGVRELAPAHRLEVRGDRVDVERYWRMLPVRRGASDGDDQGLLLDLLGQSLRHHYGDLEPDEVGLSLSGGLDSTALAALAPRGVRAYSWTFPTDPDAGERANIEAVSRHLGLPVRWIDGDGLGPLSEGFVSRFVNPSSPYVNPFAALKAELYAAARGDGCRRMVVGDGGDVLYGARTWWLRDALADRRPWARASLGSTVLRALRGDPFSRASLRRLWPRVALELGRALLARGAPAWLTREGARLLPPEQLSPILPDGVDARRADTIVGTRNIELESEERRLFAQCGVERANPFWHWPVLDMALGLPAYRLHRDGIDKVLIREAMRGRLPASVLDSGRVGLLGGLFLRGIADHRQEIVRLLFSRPMSDWQRYVRRDWLERRLAATDTLGFGHTILWRVISYELWVRRVWAPGDLPE